MSQEPPITASKRSFILVVDDEEGVRSVVGDSLEKAVPKDDPRTKLLYKPVDMTELIKVIRGFLASKTP